MDHAFEVNVFLEDSSLHASVLLPSEYPPSLREHIKSLRSSRYLTLKERLEGHTAIRQIKRLLEVQFQIPSSIQSHFSLETEFNSGWARCTYEEGVTLSEIWASQAEPEDGVLHINLSTTAARLSEIVSLRKSIDGFSSNRDGLVDCLLNWRHFDGALQYIEKNMGENRPEPVRKTIHDMTLSKYEIAERVHAQELRQMYADWSSLVHGNALQPPSHEEKETRAQRRQDIETCFQDWTEDKHNTLTRAFLNLERSVATDKSGSRLNDEALAQTRTVLSERNVDANPPDSPSPEPVSLESRLSFHFPPQNPAFSSRPLRAPSGNPKYNCKEFRVKSGVLLWGQIHTVFAGSINQDFDTDASSAPPNLQGGTIKQHVMRYRAAARKGIWKVRRAFCLPYPGNEGEPVRHFGWVVSHKDVDAVQVVDRCSRISPGSTGISNQNDHVDKDVLYINRYDWSLHCKPEKINPAFALAYKRFVQDSTGVELINERDLLPSEAQDPLLSTRRQGYLLALDASHFGNDFMYNFMNDCSPTAEDGERLFCKDDVGEEGRKGYGTYVGMKNAEYDSAWLVFSGKKHVDFPHEDELVAIVYDAAYTSLDSHRFAVEE